MAGLYREGLRRDSIPGVYVQAAAVNNLVRGDALRRVGGTARLAIASALVLTAAACVLYASLSAAAAAILILLAAWTGAATVALQGELLLPYLDPLVGIFLTMAGVFAYRFSVADRDKHELRRIFALYLPPAVVDQVVDASQPPALGGETRELTVLFTDLAGYTALSEGKSPASLVQFLNVYLSLVTDVIEAHGGFVDKYIGDSVVGVFGAPLPDPDHALHGVQAALEGQRRIADLHGDPSVFTSEPMWVRIGVNTGDMLIGNIGSRRRLNYTVMGDAVNLASRLENANQAYGTRILVSENTARVCENRIAFREIDRVRVAGREAAVDLFEPVADLDLISDGTQARIRQFAEALAHYRAGRFPEAAAAFAALAGDDPVARVYLNRTAHFRDVPREDGWQITDLGS